jgi:hypothetical protein
MNLLQETLNELKIKGKTPDDVEWVGSKDMYFYWDHFEKIANIEYHDGFGAQHIARDLVIVGKDFWMERIEYDGSESWDYRTPIIKPDHYCEVKVLHKGVWDSLKDMQAKYAND